VTIYYTGRAVLILTAQKSRYDMGMNKIGFEVLTAVVMNSSIFWDITPCSQLKVKEENIASIFRAEE
jgi:hypothetical protein